MQNKNQSNGEFIERYVDVPETMFTLVTEPNGDVKIVIKSGERYMKTSEKVFKSIDEAKKEIEEKPWYLIDMASIQMAMHTYSMIEFNLKKIAEQERIKMERENKAYDEENPEDEKMR